MKAFLTVVLSDVHTSRIDAMHGNFASDPVRRTVKLELTAEQVAALGITEFESAGVKVQSDQVTDAIVEVVP